MTLLVAPVEQTLIVPVTRVETPASLPARRWDPRIYQIATLGCLLAYGIGWLGFDVEPRTAAIILGTVLVAQATAAHVTRTRFEPRSALISGLSLCLLLRTGSPELAAAAAVLAIAGKFLLRVGRKHVFNPTNGALIAMLLLTDQVWVSPGQWGSTAIFAFLLASAGGLVVNRAARADVLFVPGDEDIHRPGHRTRVEVERMQDVLCGRSRPGHFRGVTTVVMKLLAIVGPDVVFFGEKDAQQLRIVRRMALDLHLEARIVSCPTVREEDGLALSSRNAYLGPEERRAAPVLYRALRSAAAAFCAGESGAGRLVDVARGAIAAEPFARLDYVEAVDGETLEPLTVARAGTLIAAAAWFGRARLIDNVTLSMDV